VRSRPRLVKEANMAPESVGWLSERLEHLNLPETDPAQLPVALVKG
jgi:hypothetical protein